jgi:hypothetical protein
MHPTGHPLHRRDSGAREGEGVARRPGYLSEASLPLAHHRLSLVPGTHVSFFNGRFCSRFIFLLYIMIFLLSFDRE